MKPRRGARRRDAVGFDWRPNEGIARCSVYVRGTRGRIRKRLTIHAADRDEAYEKWLIFRRKWKRSPGDRRDVPTFREFIAQYFGELTAGLKPSTVKDYHYTIHGRLMKHFGDMKLDEITSGRVNLFVKQLKQAKNIRDAKKPLSPYTINATIDVLKLVINQAVRFDVLEETPLRKPIEHVKVTPPTLELSIEERRRFLAAFDDEAGSRAFVERTMPRGNVREIAVARSAKDRFGGRRKHGAGMRSDSDATKEYYARFRFLKPAFVALLELGLRRADMLALRWSEVDLDAGLIQLTTRKRDVAVVLPISKMCRDALLECRHRPVLSEFVFTTETGKLIPEVRLRRAFTIAKEIAGFPKSRRLRIHDLRHTFASQLVSKGVSLSVVATLLAHSDIRTTTRYARAEKVAAAEIARVALDRESA